MNAPSSPTPSMISTFRAFADPKKLLSNEQLSTKRMQEIANQQAAQSRRLRQEAIARRRQQVFVEETPLDASFHVDPLPEADVKIPDIAEVKMPEVKVPDLDLDTTPPIPSCFPKDTVESKATDASSSSNNEEQKQADYKQAQPEERAQNESTKKEKEKTYTNAGHAAYDLAVRNATFGLVMGTGVVESILRMLNFSSLQMKNLKDNVNAAIENHQFDPHIQELVSIPWIRELLGNHVAGFASLMATIVMETHDDNVNNIEGGYRKNKPQKAKKDKPEEEKVTTPKATKETCHHCQSVPQAMPMPMMYGQQIPLIPWTWAQQMGQMPQQMGQMPQPISPPPISPSPISPSPISTQPTAALPTSPQPIVPPPTWMEEMEKMKKELELLRLQLATKAQEAPKAEPKAQEQTPKAPAMKQEPKLKPKVMAKAPEAKASEVKAPEVKAPEVKATEVKAPEKPIEEKTVIDPVTGQSRPTFGSSVEFRPIVNPGFIDNLTPTLECLATMTEPAPQKIPLPTTIEF